MTLADLADAAAIPPKLVRQGFDLLEEIGLIEVSESGAWSVVRWKERQFESDDVSLRTAKHRSKERSNNGDVTHQIQSTNTDTDNYPLTPAERGNPRSLGTNPRAVAKRQEIESLEAKLAGCTACGDGWTCARCSGIQRKIAEVSA